MDLTPEQFAHKVIVQAIVHANADYVDDNPGRFLLCDDREKFHFVRMIVKGYVTNQLTFDDFKREITNYDVVAPSFWTRPV